MIHHALQPAVSLVIKAWQERRYIKMFLHCYRWEFNKTSHPDHERTAHSIKSGYEFEGLHGGDLSSARFCVALVKAFVVSAAPRPMLRAVH